MSSMTPPHPRHIPLHQQCPGRVLPMRRSWDGPAQAGKQWPPPSLPSAPQPKGWILLLRPQLYPCPTLRRAVP